MSNRQTQDGGPVAGRARELGDLLAALRPALVPGVYVFAGLPAGLAAGDLPAVAMVREAEGVTVVVEEAAASEFGLVAVFRAAWITLTVASDLAAIGLTAAVATALADEGIACNVVAGLRHDHLFVPVADAGRALAALGALQARAGG